MSIEYIFYAFFQGILEFVPISSSGHLILLGVDDIFIITTAHLGSLLAVCVFLAPEIKTYLCAFFVKCNNPIAIGIKFRELNKVCLLALAPLLVIPFLSIDFIFSHEVVIGFLFLNGLLLMTACTRGGDQGYSVVTPRKGFFIGVAQLFAVLPGISRSGMIVVASSAQNVSVKHAAMFSLIIGVPTLLGAWLLSIQGLDSSSILYGDFITILIVSFFSSLVSIKIFLRVVEKVGVLPFAVYCLLTPIFLLI